MKAVGVASVFFGLALAAPSPYWEPSPPSERIKCPVIFDGRIPKNFTSADFDISASPFNTRVVKGQNLSWSEIVEPVDTGLNNRFDLEDQTAIAMTINDSSIFFAGEEVLQAGFRRAGFLFEDDENDEADPSDKGVVTLHWSVQQDLMRPLNWSHEYMNVWHELADFSGNQFDVLAGELLDDSRGERAQSWKFQDRNGTIMHETAIQPYAWQNFAVTIDYNKE